MISVYNNLTEIELNNRRIDLMQRYTKLIQWGRSNPTRFIELIFGIELFDYQKWIILNTWQAKEACWVCSRAAGKSFMLAIYTMTRNLLFPKMNTYIMSYTGNQAKDTFTKLEDIVKHNIQTLMNTTDVFYTEVVQNAQNSDGFCHGQDNYTFSLYNGSSVTSLVGASKNIVGKRSNLNIYDEAGKIGQEFFDLTEPFTAVSENVKTGKGFNAEIFPLNIPNQHIYASSAEDVSSRLYTVYKDCAMQMMMGNRDYFCADINCDIPLHPKKDGKEVPPLLTQSKIDGAFRKNEAKALREYYNIFDRTGGTDAAIKRYEILRNEENYLPIFRSHNPNSIFAICFDPAAETDNSFVLIGELFKDKEKGWMGRIVNGINFIEVLSDNTKKPLSSPAQLARLQELILGYNGKNPEYNNIELYIDAGTGGGGRSIYAQQLVLGWTDEIGISHLGLLDTKDASTKEREWELKYPTAVDKLRLMEPKTWKTTMYTELVDMIQQDLIKFPSELPRNGEMEIGDKKVQLTEEDVRALVEIDLVKEEVFNITKVKTNAGNLVYTLPPDKIRKMHDDRAYCLALFGHALATMRQAENQSDSIPGLNWLRKEQSCGVALGVSKKVVNPFSGLSNPFSRR